MKPNRIINMMAFVLLIATIFNCVITIFSSESVVKLIVNMFLSFIFPTIIFIFFWRVQLERNEKGIKLPKFYSSIYLNMILPYFICLIPYIVYNTEKNNFLTIIITGNYTPCFMYLKTLIGLSFVYPVVEFFIKKNAKNTLIVTLALTFVFSLWNISDYLLLNAIEYLFFVAVGVYFAENSKKANRFLREYKGKFLNCFIESLILLVFTTIFNFYNFVNPVCVILYSIVMRFRSVLYLL